MRPYRPCLASFGALLFTAGTFACSGSASAEVTNYVALGDSYSSGTGAGDYEPGSGSCNRSANAYPRLWAAKHSTASVKFVACSGATTATVRSGQLSALSGTTTLVSITVGGNDAGFGTVMQTCVLRSTSSCQTAVTTAEKYISTTLPGKLDSLYRDIRAKSPSAQVIVLGYPRLYKMVDGCVGLNQTKRAALNKAADALDTTIEKSVANAGLTFSDVRDEFAGHELCSGDGWLHSVTIPLGSSYHPTAIGHARGYLPAMNALDVRSLAM